MEFLIGFFSSLFVNCLLISGEGINGYKPLAEKKGMAKYVAFIYYFIASVILGFVSYGLSLVKDNALLTDFTLFIIVVLAIVLAVAFYFITKYCFKGFFDELKDSIFDIIINTASISVALSVVTLVLADGTLPTVLGNIFGLPIGFLVSVLVFAPIQERISNSNAPKYFKGIPLALLSLACLALATYGLSF